MKIRTRLATVAVASALTATLTTATTPVAGAQPTTSADAFSQSAEPIAVASSEFYVSLYENPVTTPIAVVFALSAMSWQYLIYCPIAQRIGLEPPYSPNCTF